MLRDLMRANFLLNVVCLTTELSGVCFRTDRNERLSAVLLAEIGRVQCIGHEIFFKAGMCDSVDPDLMEDWKGVLEDESRLNALKNELEKLNREYRDLNSENIQSAIKEHQASIGIGKIKTPLKILSSLRENSCKNFTWSAFIEQKFNSKFYGVWAHFFCAPYFWKILNVLWIEIALNLCTASFFDDEFLVKTTKLTGWNWGTRDFLYSGAIRNKIDL